MKMRCSVDGEDMVRMMMNGLVGRNGFGDSGYENVEREKGGKKTGTCMAIWRNGHKSGKKWVLWVCMY